MPELVRNGPDIPPDLLNQQEDGRVVFFCGAGVSKGAASRLPDFPGLLCHVYQDNHLEPDDIEREALKEREYDKVFELLERPARLRPKQIYESVVERLSVPPAGSLQMHRDLLALSRVERGHRLVTTNFDNRFREAAAELPALGQQLRMHDAPALPAPNRHRWRTLVHLHGRIQREGDRSDLVLTTADFGRAYLTERWAARFVTALFREFTVVFVGYSLSDPVMKYLVDAVAAERAKGGDLGMAYAFVGCDPDKMAKVRSGWIVERNVEPILYDEKDEHALLRDTFRKWADVRSDPQTRRRIAVQGIRTYPEPGDPEVARVTWALERADIAQGLAQAPPVTDEQDFLKIERWLDVFAEAGLLSRVASGPDTTDRPVQLVDDGSRSRSPLRLSEATRQLACWVARHLHVPQVLGWVARNGGRVHPELRWEIRRKLADPAETIPPRLRHLWTVVLGENEPDPRSLLFLEEQYQKADGTEKHRLEEVVLSSMTPRLTVLPGPSDRAVFRFDPDPPSMSPIDTCGHLRVRFGHDGTELDAVTMLSDAAFLCRHAERITACLVDTLVLMRHDDQVLKDRVTGRARLSHPQWIAADTDRFYSHYAWTRLIDLARDSYFALAKSDREQATALLRRWVQTEEPTCKRLVLHALAEDEASETGLAEAVLLLGEAPGIWDPYLRNEVLRFLNKAGSRLGPGLLKRIVRAIHAGPDKAGSDRNEIDPNG